MISSIYSGYNEWIWEDLIIPNHTEDPTACTGKLKKSCNTTKLVDAEIMYHKSSISIESDNEEYWTEAKDDMLMKLAVRFEFQWNKLGVFFDGKSTISLRKRWNLIKKAAVNGIRLHDESSAILHKNSSSSDIYKTHSNISYPKDTLHYFLNRLSNHKESYGISSLIPYRYLSNESKSDSYNQCNEEDSTSTATSEDCSSLGIKSPYSSQSEHNHYSLCHLSIKQKRKILRQLYVKVDQLEVILKDTHHSLIKLTQTIEDRKKLN